MTNNVAAIADKPMLLSEFKQFRKQVVDAEKAHPEWKKAESNPYTFKTEAPNSPAACTYWRIRNGSEILMRKYANIAEGAACQLEDAYNSCGDWELDSQDARNIRKWQQEFQAIV